MANLWEKVKQTLEQGAKVVKEGAESVAKTVAEKAPQITSTLAEKGQELAGTISDKTQEMVTMGQLKLKHYNQNRDVSNLFNEIGGHVYELIRKNDQQIYKNPEIIKLIEDVKKLELDIDNIEKKMKDLHTQKTETEEKPKEQTKPKA